MEPEPRIERVRRFYDGLADNGPFATQAPHNRGGRKGRYIAEVFDAALLPRLQEAGPVRRLLDLGCGTGIFCRRVAGRVPQVVGVDLSPDLLALAARLCSDFPGAGFLRSDGIHLPFAEACFDCVVAREVLCYVEDRDLPPLLGEVRRVLSPGGTFLWLDQVTEDPCWQQDAAAHQMVRRSPCAMQRFARDSGLFIREARTVRTPRFPWIYPVWFGLVPSRLIPPLARMEVAWHHRHPGRRRRWWNELLVLEKGS